jgi:RHS repeat-associated protein
MTNSQGATSSFAPNNMVTTTGQTAGDPLVRATFGSAYDEVNRLLSLTAPDLAIGYTYDAVGNLLTMTDATGTTTYTYDTLNRLTQITYPTGLTIGYTYNEVGRITSIATPYGGVGYAYDDANRLTTITLPNNQQVVYQYDAAGNLLQVENPNGTAAAYAYDTRNRLTAMTNFAPGNTVISTYAYTLDGVGNRTRVDLNEPMMPSYNAETINYTYFLGNILNTADGNTYTHDANGNRIQKSGSGGTTTYTYDSLNRLVQVVKGSQINQYIYNGLGQRVGRIDNGIQTNYLIDPNGILPQVLAETDNTGNLISFYVYDGVGLVAKVTPSNQYYFYHYDGLGSTIAITDSAGQVVNTYCYSPEGLVGAQETIINPFQYVGRFGVMAEGNGLYCMRARYYDPETGQFISKDPIGYAGGMNLFTYVGNNPINFIDLYGLEEIKDPEKFKRWLIAAGLINESTNVTITSINVLKLGSKTTHLLGRATSFIGIGLNAYDVYEEISNKDALKTSSSSCDLTVGIATLTIASAGHPEVAAAVTIGYVGGKWWILSTSDNFTTKIPERYISGGGGATIRRW